MRYQEFFQIPTDKRTISICMELIKRECTDHSLPVLNRMEVMNIINQHVAKKIRPALEVQCRLEGLL